MTHDESLSQHPEDYEVYISAWPRRPDAANDRRPRVYCHRRTRLWWVDASGLHADDDEYDYVQTGFSSWKDAIEHALAAWFAVSQKKGQDQ